MTQDVLDMLIVGGGPGGTAAAFRARELGIEPLILEHDDLMKRIRDYSKDKLILPGFGGGDRMRFPQCGDLVSCLHFQPIDKDDMCAEWKALHVRHGICSRIGVELTGLERRADGLWAVQGWDHAGRREAAFAARHVVLAIGRGVPRRFDIPGSTDGIAFRLRDPQVFVGASACVIGGGTSAAEAVIEISNAKAAAGDPTAVYWSYRGDKMPRVSKALAEVFFEAYVGNGNVRYYPRSEPAAVVTADDRREYLAVRVDRRTMDGRPGETTHLEFAKEQCLACIGEDIPETLLASFGIRMATGGPRNRKRMVVNRYLETEQPNVYLVGDILSQAHFETQEFGADPAGFREVKHRGNIKSALRDGVLVAQVVAQRLRGKTEIDVRIEDAEEVEAPSPAVMAGYGRAADEDSPHAASLEAGRRLTEAAAHLVRVLPGGIEEEEYPIAEGAVLTLGREGCDVSFPSDTLQSPRHASITGTSEGYFLRDDGSATGVFLRVPSRRKITVVTGDLLRAGRQFLLFTAADGGHAVTHFDAAGKELGQYPLPERTIVLGRQAPDVTLDPNDGTLSRRQLAITVASGSRPGGAPSEGRPGGAPSESIQVKDLKSVNGTYLRVRSALKIEHGDQFRVGQQLFTFSLEGDAVLDRGHATPVPGAGAPRVEQETEHVSVAGGMVAASVTFLGLGKTFPVAPGQTICDVAEAHGVPLNAECHSGICGSDPVRIHAGHENLAAPPDDGESETLEDICDLEPGPCRLACMARIKGPVEVEIM